MSIIRKAIFGTTKDGSQVYEYILENEKGMQVHILTYSGIIRKLLVPDASGALVDVVVGFDNLKDYEDDGASIGAFVGRYAGRIKNASFVLNGKTWQLPQNEGKNHLHGVLNHRVFDACEEGDQLLLTYVSPDGEDGFPGELKVTISYQLTEDNQLLIGYDAVSDQDTVLNLTNHSYFNLNGQDGSEVCNHLLTLHSSTVTLTDEGNVCTGEFLDVKGQDLDFSCEKNLSLLHSSKDPLILATKGIDHNYVIQGEALAASVCTGLLKLEKEQGENQDKPLRQAASLYSPKTGIRMECATTQPGVQVYTANFLAADHGKNGISYPEYGAVCLETQHYPNSPNVMHFPSVLLKAGESFKEWTVYSFC